MIKKNLKTLIITSILILFPMLAGILVWNQLPDQIPAHWNLNGEVDSWVGKPFAVFGFPVIMLALHWLCMFVTTHDPKKANLSDKIFQLVLWIIPVLNIFLGTIICISAIGKDVPMDMAIPIFIGLLLAIIGNYLPKCKQTYTVGIRLPWTLNNEENWNKTHRFSGKIWVVCGLLMMLSGFLGGFWLFFPSCLLMILAPLLYSYILYRKGI